MQEYKEENINLIQIKQKVVSCMKSFEYLYKMDKFLGTNVLPNPTGMVQFLFFHFFLNLSKHILDRHFYNHRMKKDRRMTWNSATRRV